MTVSIDDLVTSFSSNHIGQDALDLAALQAQLSQTLFTQSLASIPRSPIQPCNTPTGRTRTSSFSCVQMSDSTHPLRLPIPLSHLSTDELCLEADEMDQDEQMVEDLLIPASPASRNTSPPRYPLTWQGPYPMPNYTCHSTTAPSYTCAAEASASLFTSTDPFYIAQLQAAQNYSNVPPSFFAQAGHPVQHSPFLKQQQQQQQQQQQHPQYQLHQRGESFGCMQESVARDNNHAHFIATSAAVEH